MRRTLTGASLGVLLGLTTACGSGAHRSAPTTVPTTAAPTSVAPSTEPATPAPQRTSPSTRSAPSTTTVPPAPEASPQVVSGTFIGAWIDHDRAAAERVATAAAVSVLFAHRYQGEPLNSRGCRATGGPNVVICSWGPYGGADPNDPLYQVQVSPTKGGRWYVASVQVLVG